MQLLPARCIAALGASMCSAQLDSHKSCPPLNPQLSRSVCTVGRCKASCSPSVCTVGRAVAAEGGWHITVRLPKGRLS